MPLSFQGALGLAGVMAPGIIDGTGVAQAMANMVGGGPFITNLLVVMLLLALMLAITTAMAGSSRTLYQGSVDGWLPRYLSHVNKNGAPTHGMWTDLTFNLVLLLMSDYLFVLAVSNVCYIVFNFLNLNAGWIHRIDNAHVRRPWKAPDWLLATGVVLAFVNAFLLGAGADVWGKGTLIVRHRGHCPDRARSSSTGTTFRTRACSRPICSPIFRLTGRASVSQRRACCPISPWRRAFSPSPVAYVIFWT